MCTGTRSRRRKGDRNAIGASVITICERNEVEVIGEVIHDAELSLSKAELREGVFAIRGRTFGSWMGRYARFACELRVTGVGEYVLDDSERVDAYPVSDWLARAGGASIEFAIPASLSLTSSGEGRIEFHRAYEPQAVRHGFRWRDWANQ